MSLKTDGSHPFKLTTNFDTFQDGRNDRTIYQTSSSSEIRIVSNDIYVCVVDLSARYISNNV